MCAFSKLFKIQRPRFTNFENNGHFATAIFTFSKSRETSQLTFVQNLGNCRMRTFRCGNLHFKISKLHHTIFQYVNFVNIQKCAKSVIQFPKTFGFRITCFPVFQKHITAVFSPFFTNLIVYAILQHFKKHPPRRKLNKNVGQNFIVLFLGMFWYSEFKKTKTYSKSQWKIVSDSMP